MKVLQLLVPILAIMAIGCGGGSNSNNGGGGGGVTPAATIAMTGSHSFDPSTVTVPAGSVIQWKNTDTTHHTVASDTSLTGFNSDGSFPSGLPGGSTFNFTVPAGTPSGTVLYYHCEFHGAAGDGTHLGTGMAASITVQ